MTYRRQMRRTWLAVLAPLVACGPDDTSSACKDNLLAGDLVVTEVFADFAGTGTGTATDDGKEWFEVYNNAERPISLKGVTVVHSRPDGSKSATHAIDDVTLAPGQFFTLGNATQDLVPAYVDYGYGADLGDFFNSDGGKLALKCGDSLIDEAIYDTVKSGHSRQLSSAAPPDYTLNDDAMNWCEAKSSEFEANNFGTPGQENDCSPIIMGACNDNGTMRPVVSPAPGQLVITEIMASPDGTDSETEWFEARALASFDLNGLGIGRISDTTPDPVGTTDCIPVTDGTDVVFAHTLDSSKNSLPAGKVLATFATGLSGTSSTGADIQITLGGAVVDAVTWAKATTNKSSQLNSGALSATANDDFSNFCDSTTSYPDTTGMGLTNFGTPGAPNGQCASQPPAGMCDMGGGSFRAIVKPPAGALVISEIMPNPATEPTQEWFEITNVGSASFDLNGLGLDRPDDDPAPTVVTSMLCKPLLPNTQALFARSLDAVGNGGLPTPDASYGFSLIQSNGTIQIVDPTSCSGTPSVCTMIYDSAVWTSSTDKKSLQLPPQMLNTTANDVSTNYCPGVAVYGTPANGNLGTPKATNSCT
jgi:hypothetical protein